MIIKYVLGGRPVQELRASGVDFQAVRIALEGVQNKYFNGNIPLDFIVLEKSNLVSFQKGTGAYFSPFERHICVYLDRLDTTRAVIQTLVHELGHVHHYANDVIDMFSRTPYGRELYAEQFASDVMGNDYRLEHKTVLSRYPGYKGNQVYRFDPRLVSKDLTKHPEFW